MNPDRLVEQVLDLVTRIAPAGTEAEVTAETHTLALTRFANSYIHQNVSDITTTVRLRLHTCGRTAAGSTTVTSVDGLTSLVERAVAASRLLPADLGWPGLTPPTPASGAGNHDPETAQAEPADRARVVRDFITAAEGLTAAGYCRTTGTRRSFGNTAGHRIAAAASSAAVDGVVRTGGSDGVARAARVRLADLDGATLGAVAAAKARAGVDPADIPPGEYPVLLEPSAVTDVVLLLNLWGYNGKALTERRSFVRLGQAQLDRSITLVDDPLRPDALHLPFDAEGTPGQRLDLVRDGVSVGVAHDRRTAREAGVDSTGHAVPPIPPMRLWPFGLATRLGPGTTACAPTAGRPVAGDSVAGLLAGMDRGLLVSDLWYTRVLDPRTLVVTGLTRNGVWLVERGEIVHPVGNLRFTQSYPGALEPGRVRAIGSEAVTTPYNWGLTSVAAPAVLLDSWNFTGGAVG
jgi:predicted Zn-dependent protease